MLTSIREYCDNTSQPASPLKGRLKITQQNRSSIFQRDDMRKECYRLRHFGQVRVVLLERAKVERCLYLYELNIYEDTIGLKNKAQITMLPQKVLLHG